MDFLYSFDFTELLQQSQYAGLIVFLIAFLETLLLVGFFFPGSVALVAIGGLISTGTLELWPTLLWAYAGAVIGDNISFWIGVYFQEPLKRSSLYARHVEAFHKGEQFFQKYGIYSVALGRFIGPIRAVIPAIAGSMGMSGKVFFIVNVFSALIWAPAYILPGLLFGDLYTHLEQYIEIKLGSLLLITLAIVIALALIKRSKHDKKIIAYIGLILVSAFWVTVTQIKYPW
jgi:membrane protein DedA with SNARE-associated domain